MKSIKSVITLVIQIITFAIALITIIIVDRVSLCWSGSSSTALVCSFFAVISNIAMNFIYNFFEDEDGCFAVLAKIIFWPVGIAAAALCVICSVLGFIGHWEDFSPLVLSFEFMWMFSVVISFSFFRNNADEDDDGGAALFATPLSIIFSYIVALPIAFLMQYIPIELLRFVAFIICSLIAIVVLFFAVPDAGLGSLIEIIGGLFAGLLDTASDSGGDTYIDGKGGNNDYPTDIDDGKEINEYAVEREIRTAVDRWIDGGKYFGGLPFVDSVYANWSRKPMCDISRGKVKVHCGIILISSLGGYYTDATKSLMEHKAAEVKSKLFSTLMDEIEDRLDNCRYATKYDYNVELCDITFDFYIH